MPFAFRSVALSELSLRHAVDHDLPLLALLYASTRREEVARSGWSPEVQRAFLQQQHEAQHRHYRSSIPQGEWYVIERSGDGVGRLYLQEQRHAVHVVDITLLAECRGKGWGTAILKDILSYAADLDKRVTIHLEKNNPARSLYERLGFEIIEDRGLYDFLQATPRA